MKSYQDLVLEFGQYVMLVFYSLGFYYIAYGNPNGYLLFIIGNVFFMTDAYVKRELVYSSLFLILSLITIVKIY